MINSIELKNWKTHKDTKLVFTKGTNVLVGMMGAGKSSIMDAISYALFGTFPSVKHGRVNINDLIMSRPSQESDASVKLNFTLDGRDYSVERVISFDEGSKATLERDGEYLQSQPVRVNEEIARILKVDYDLFSRAIYSEQNRLDYFLELRAGERKNQIDELLGLDKFATAQENAKSLINRIKETISEHEKIISSFDSTKLSSELKLLEGEIADLRKKRESLELEHGKIGAESKKIESSLKELKEEFTKKTRFARELAEIKSKIEIITSEMTKLESFKLPSKAEIEKEVTETNAELHNTKVKEDAAREKERKAMSELSTIEATIKQIKQRTVGRDKIQQEYKDKNIDAEQTKLNSASESLHNLEKMLATYQSQKEETRKAMLELEKHISKCPVCERDLDEQMKAKLVEAKKSTLAAANSGISESDTEIKKKKVEVENITKALDSVRLAHAKLKEYVGLDDQLKENDQKLVASKNQYEGAKSESGLCAKNRETLSSKLNDTNSKKEKVDRLENYKRQFTDLNSASSLKAKELDSVRVDEQALDKVQKEFVEITSRTSKILSEMEAHKRYISDKQKLIDEKNDQVKHINKLMAEINEKKAAADNLVKFRNALDETQRLMRTKLVGSINDVMHNVWPEMYPYNDYTGIMLDAATNDYVLMVRTANGSKEKWEEVQGIASGGERSIACLALRVAFALVLVPNLKWIILDEPTHNIDQEGMSRFVRVFNEKLPQIIEQIFIITHDEVLKHAASSKTYLLTRDKAENGATIIQEQ
ncbi:MAG: AAA family ATPase [Candidatus Micrarchaeales archaeon]